MSELSDLADALNSQSLHTADSIVKAVDIYNAVKGLYGAWTASKRRELYEDYLRGKPLHTVTDEEIDALSALKIDEAGKATALFNHPSGDLTELAKGLDIYGNRLWKSQRDMAKFLSGNLGHRVNKSFEDAQS